ncbi:hypothetical protein JKP88DRAFT_349703 [Tribonema minus]|uniref:Anaphase-promoting complex subunit 4 n=1 Tax=Tribonema minus TaxID=303371 RepID=A0A835YRB0_9STRA|nr:hypothetical protein JKP88DRAFT_349703 [Tribonema minus]
MSPVMDLIAGAHGARVSLFRAIPWKRALSWEDKDKAAGSAISTLVWSPDGTVLAVGYQDGSLAMVGLENGKKEMAFDAPHGKPLVALCWAVQAPPPRMSAQDQEEDEVAALASIYADRAHLILGSKTAGGAPAESDQQRQQQHILLSSATAGALTILAAADAGGAVTLYIGGMFKLCVLDLAAELQFQQPVTPLHLCFSGDLSRVAAAIVRGGRLEVVQVALPLLWRARHDLKALALRSAGVAALLADLRAALAAARRSWTDALSPVSARLRKLAELLRGYSAAPAATLSAVAAGAAAAAAPTPRDALLDLVTCGYAAPAVAQFFAYHMREADVAKLAQAAGTAAAAAEEATLGALARGAHALVLAAADARRAALRGGGSGGSGGTGQRRRCGGDGAGGDHSGGDDGGGGGGSGDGGGRGMMSDEAARRLQQASAHVLAAAEALALETQVARARLADFLEWCARATAAQVEGGAIEVQEDSAALVQSVLSFLKDPLAAAGDACDDDAAAAAAAAESAAGDGSGASAEDLIRTRVLQMTAPLQGETAAAGTQDSSLSLEAALGAAEDAAKQLFEGPPRRFAALPHPQTVVCVSSAALPRTSGGGSSAQQARAAAARRCCALQWPSAAGPLAGRFVLAAAQGAVVWVVVMPAGSRQAAALVAAVEFDGIVRQLNLYRHSAGGASAGEDGLMVLLEQATSAAAAAVSGGSAAAGGGADRTPWLLRNLAHAHLHYEHVNVERARSSSSGSGGGGEDIIAAAKAAGVRPVPFAELDEQCAARSGSVTGALADAQLEVCGPKGTVCVRGKGGLLLVLDLLGGGGGESDEEVDDEDAPEGRE